jgi:DNA-binding IclR family transcriptional regulator
MAVAGAVLLSIPVGRVSPRLLREVAASLRVTASRLAGTVLVSD